MTAAPAPRTSRLPLGRAGAAVIAVALALLAALVPSAPQARAATLVPISGAGSTWSQNALAQWASNVRQYGMVINYQGTGSSDGRKQFGNGTVDFGVSEIPWGLSDNGVVDPPPTVRKYAYMPIVAGGTSFMYNLKIGGKRVTTLRLSGETVAKIFTGAITTWSDPTIKAENPNLVLPARKIVPVVRSDGSGTTAQFSLWLSKRYASTWDAYCTKAGRSTPCGVTSNYPSVPGVVIAQAGSTGVAGYVAQDANEGTITYVEYSYALDAKLPVVKLLNTAGYFVEPTAANVAVGLLGATINTDANSPSYLTQQLDGVYGNTDPRAYPLSSYSYMIVPTALQAPINADKGYTLGKFAYYFLCQGQNQADDLGYSPLPLNLVQAGFDQVKKIPGVQAETISVKDCNNPTFSTDGTNTLAKNAPQPQACAKSGGSTQCGFTTPGTAGNAGTAANGNAANGNAANGNAANGNAANGNAANGNAANGNAANGNAANGNAANGNAANGNAANGNAANRSAAANGAKTSGSGTTGTTGNNGTTGTTGNTVSTGNNANAAVDPDTGQQGALPAGDAANNVQSQDQGQNNGQVSAAEQVQGVPVSLSSGYTNTAGRTALMLLAVVLLVGVTVGPPLVARYLAPKGGRERR